MAHLVLGGTGTVGGATVQALLARGEKVHVLTRSADKAKALPAGVIGVIGDLGDPLTYDAIFRGVDTVFLINALGLGELQEGLSALAEAKRAGVKRLVYLSVHDLEKGIAIPHFAGKIAIESAIKASGIPYVILRPNNFFQNDVWFQDAILKSGVYPQPFGSAGISRVDVRDIADAAVNALTDPKFENKTYALVGPEPLKAPETAAMWSRALGRPIAYGGDDLAAWSVQQRQWLPAWMVYDFAMMYTVFQTQGLVATPAQVAETTAIAGHPPRSYADYVAETVAAWT